MRRRHHAPLFVAVTATLIAIIAGVRRSPNAQGEPLNVSLSRTTAPIASSTSPAELAHITGDVKAARSVAVEGSEEAQAASPASLDASAPEKTLAIDVIAETEVLALLKNQSVSVFAVRRGRRGRIEVGSATVPGRLRWAPPEDVKYLLGIESDSLPEGFIGTGSHDLGLPEERGFGMVACGRSHGKGNGNREETITLRVFAAGSLAGRVVTPDGAPLAGVAVRAQALAPGLQRLSVEATTRDDGGFRIQRLFPTIHSLAVIDPGANARKLQALPLPAPRLYDLGTGSYDGVELRVGGGPVRLTGRVIDEIGDGVAGLSVLVYYQADAPSAAVPDFDRAYTWNDTAIHTTTDREGAFRVEGLEPIAVAVQVGAQEAANGPGRRLRYVPSPVTLPLRVGGPTSLAMDDIRVERSRRFTVTGRVEVRGSDSRGRALKAKRVELSSAPFPRDFALAGRPGVERHASIEFDSRTGLFMATCDAPRNALVLQLRHPSLRDTVREYSFVPQPDQTEEDVVLSFP